MFRTPKGKNVESRNANQKNAGFVNILFGWSHSLWLVARARRDASTRRVATGFVQEPDPIMLRTPKGKYVKSRNANQKRGIR